MSNMSASNTSDAPVLNAGGQLQENSLSALDLSKDLQRLMLKIKGTFITEEGRAVDYSALKESDLFEEYVDRTKALKAVDLGNLEQKEKIAFFLNIYNSLTIHGLAMCENGLPNSVLEIENFWRRTSYNIGGYTFSLDDIEHGILRGNRPHPSGGKPLFDDTDPRLQFTVTEVDPRIHFALVCGAKSCPAIRVFSSENLERGLDSAAKSFCTQEVCIDKNGVAFVKVPVSTCTAEHSLSSMKRLKTPLRSTVTDGRLNSLAIFHIHKHKDIDIDDVITEFARLKVTLSRIFLWYKTDFGSTEQECLRWIAQHLAEEEQDKLKSLMEVTDSGSSIDVSYSKYNWDLNGSKL